MNQPWILLWKFSFGIRIVVINNNEIQFVLFENLANRFNGRASTVHGNY